MNRSVSKTRTSKCTTYLKKSSYLSCDNNWTIKVLIIVIMEWVQKHAAGSTVENTVNVLIIVIMKWIQKLYLCLIY